MNRKNYTNKFPEMVMFLSKRGFKNWEGCLIFIFLVLLELGGFLKIQMRRLEKEERLSLYSMPSCESKINQPGIAFLDFLDCKFIAITMEKFFKFQVLQRKLVLLSEQK